jgi:CBS-domain-containing membrane protein
VVIDEELRPVGVLRGSPDALFFDVDAKVREVMGMSPAVIEGDTATVGDVAVICAAAAHDEPVAITDNEGRLRRVLRQEDLLEPIRSQLREESESRFGGSTR